MKQKFFILFTFFIFAKISFSQDVMKKDAVQELQWLNGNWVGIGFQPSAMNQKSWEINLTYNAKQGFSINYPSFPCNGYWELMKFDQNKATFVEHLTDGLNVCQDKNVVVVTRIDDNFITVSYFFPQFTQDVVAFSTLKRKSVK